MAEATVITLQEGGPTQNEIQQITIDASGGTFDLYWGGPFPFSGQLLGITWDVSAVDLAYQINHDMLDAPTDGASVTKAGAVYTVEYIDWLALTEIPESTADGSDLTGSAAGSVSMRVCTGTGAANESVAQTGFALMSIDSAVNDPDANVVDPGSNSFEKWIRLAVDISAGLTLSGFWIERTGDLPDGVVVKIGIASAGATPVATTSTVATETMHSGRRYWFDSAEYDANGDRTAFVVLQEQVAADAPSGQIDTQSFEWGWSAA